MTSKRKTIAAPELDERTALGVAEGQGGVPFADGIPVYCSFSELVATEALIENPKNPNRHPMAQLQALAKIIRHQGWRAPITVSERSGFITKGHGRLKAAKLLQVTLVPVDVQQYASEAEEWADMVADNKIAELAETDEAMLAGVLRDLDAQHFDVELAGMLKVDIDAILAGPTTADGGTPKEAPAPDATKPEQEFTQELMESHNYVVLYFDNEVDWMAAKEVLGLGAMHSDRSRKGFVRKGIGRVLRGAPIVAKLQDGGR